MEQINSHENEINPDLENKSAFTKRREIYGIPAAIFIGVLGLAAFGAFVMISYLGVWLGLLGGFLLSLIILIPVYLIHLEDPDGWLVWLRSSWAPDLLDPCRITRRRVLLLHWANNDPKVKNIFSKEHEE